jgi:hypothetical protein
VCFRCVFQVFQKHVSSVSTALRWMLQPLFLDVSKVDQCCISPPPTFCCIVSLGAGKGIHTNEGWAMDAGRGSYVHRAQVRELHAGGCYLWCGMGTGRRGAGVRRGWEQGHRCVVTWSWRACTTQRTQFYSIDRFYVRGARQVYEWEPCPDTGARLAVF